MLAPVLTNWLKLLPLLLLLLLVVVAVPGMLLQVWRLPPLTGQVRDMWPPLLLLLLLSAVALTRGFCFIAPCNRWLHVATGAATAGAVSVAAAASTAAGGDTPTSRVPVVEGLPLAPSAAGTVACSAFRFPRGTTTAGSSSTAT
jgi:hypothetical protein